MRSEVGAKRALKTGSEYVSDKNYRRDATSSDEDHQATRRTWQ